MIRAEDFGGTIRQRIMLWKLREEIKEEERLEEILKECEDDLNSYAPIPMNFDSNTRHLRNLKGVRWRIKSYLETATDKLGMGEIDLIALNYERYTGKPPEDVYFKYPLHSSVKTKI